MSSRIIFLVSSTKWPSQPSWRVDYHTKLTLVIELAFDGLKICILIETLIFHVLGLLHLTTISLRRQGLRRRVLLRLLGMPLHMTTVKRAITASELSLRNTATPSTATSSDVTMPWIMNLMRSSHYSLFRSGRHNHSSWFLILNWSLRVLDLLL